MWNTANSRVGFQPRSIKTSFELPPSVQDEAEVPEPRGGVCPAGLHHARQHPLAGRPWQALGTHMMKIGTKYWYWRTKFQLVEDQARRVRRVCEIRDAQPASQKLHPGRRKRKRSPSHRYPRPSLLPQPVSGNLGTFIVGESTSLQPQPTHESSASLRLRSGMKVKLLEKTSKLWWKVEVNGLSGYAKAANLSAE